MGIKLKATITCDGKTVPDWDAWPCPTNTTVEVEVNIIYSRTGLSLEPELPFGWWDSDDEYHCPACQKKIIESY